MAPPVEFVHASKPLTGDEIRRRLSQGWMVIPRLPVRDDRQIAVPSEDAPFGVQPFDVWFVPPAQVPIQVVAETVNAVARTGGDPRTLDVFCRHLFGVPLEEVVRESMEES